MKPVQPAALEFMAEKERQEKKRHAYLLRKYGAEGVWKLQQQAMTDLAGLKPALLQRHRTQAKKDESK